MMPPRLSAFQKTVRSHYHLHGRSMPWRTDHSPYAVVVSEIMLQQTQVDRVMKKFGPFMERFPDWQTLAKASTKEVLQEWSGLGYNRRVLYLKRIAEIITNGGKTKGVLPKTFEGLRKLPGIGPNTAGSILAFAFNIPRPFIETNIRSVFIHAFFPDVEKKEGKRACKKIHDDELMPFIEKTLDKKNPREWYYALMDYGAHLKKQLPNPSRQSAHHIRQSPFKGSNRELRGKILRTVMKKGASRQMILKRLKGYAPQAIMKNLNMLAREGFLKEKNGTYSIA